jgi:hypothetical protein
MAANLKAENLTISVPNTGCNKNCPYCVSRMTGYMEHDFGRMLMKVDKVKKVATAAEITSVLFTGKGEPTFGTSFNMLRQLLNKFEDWPCELQTNGILLNENLTWLSQLFLSGLDVLAVSIDSDKQMKEFEPLFKEVKKLGMVARITVNVTQLMGAFHPMWWINECERQGISQLTFRRVTIPESNLHKKTAEWISKNAPDHLYRDLNTTVGLFARDEGRLIRSLKNGIQIWDINDVAVATSDYCIQERDEGDNLRSLVFQEDGHLYTGWGSKAAILF